MTPAVDILIPTCCRPAALAVTLTSLCAQTFRDFRVVISAQTEDSNPVATGEVQAVLRVLRAHGHSIDVHKHLPRWGIAEQRQFLLDRVAAPYGAADKQLLKSKVKTPKGRASCAGSGSGTQHGQKSK